MKGYKTWLVALVSAVGLLIILLSLGQSGSDSPGLTSASGLVRGCLAREPVNWCPGGPFGAARKSANSLKLPKKTSGTLPLQTVPKARPMI